MENNFIHALLEHNLTKGIHERKIVLSRTEVQFLLIIINKCTAITDLILTGSRECHDYIPVHLFQFKPI